MNKLTLEKIATPLLKACKDEGLMYKEAAKIFNTEPAYFKMLEREDKREAIPEKVMDRFHSWVYSGKKLKEYKMPGSYEETQREADAGMGNRINEEMAEVLNNSGATIIEPKEGTIIGPYDSIPKLTKAVAEHEKKARRKREPKAKFVFPTEKPKRKYTRKAKENPPETTSPVVHVIPIWKGDIIKRSWRQICPDGAMMEDSSITTVAQSVGVPESFVREIIETEIAKKEQQKEEVISCNPQSEESETDLLKSEIKTLAFLLAREHEANEVLRAQNGYLNARIAYKVNKATDIIRELNKENNALRDKAKSIDDRILGYKIGDIIEKVNRLRKENNELEDQIRKYLQQGFWDRVLRRPVK